MKPNDRCAAAAAGDRESSSSLRPAAKFRQIRLKVQQQKPTITSFGVIEVGNKTREERIQKTVHGWEEKKEVFSLSFWKLQENLRTCDIRILGLSRLTDIIVAKAWGLSQWPLWLWNVQDNGFFMPSEMNAGFMIYTPWSRPDNTVADEPHDAQKSPLERSENALQFIFTIEAKPTVETLRPDLLLGGRKIKSCTMRIGTPPWMKAKQASSVRDGY